jgi:hypothetical protein
MAIQIIKDNMGNTTGVFIPIDQWIGLKSKYTDLQTEESSIELDDWNKNLMEERLADYANNKTEVEDFDKMIQDLEKDL